MRELLLCAPDYYGIEYEINPWMSRARGAEAAVAQKQWKGLHTTLSKLDCKIHLIAPQPKLPDMVFTANAGLVVGSRFIRSNFRFAERQGEELLFEQWFVDHNYEILHLPEGLFFEGEGDALFCNNILFCGYRFRSDIRSHQALGEILGSRTGMAEMLGSDLDLGGSLASLTRLACGPAMELLDDPFPMPILVVVGARIPQKHRYISASWSW